MKLNIVSTVVLSSMEPCPKLDIFKADVKCDCSKVHDYDTAKELCKPLFTLRLKAIELLQHCHGGPALERIEQELCKNIITSLFPANCNVSDVRIVAQNFNNPSVTFAVERYISKIAEAPGDDAKLRKLMLYFLTSSSLLELKELSKDDKLHDLQNSCIFNRQKPTHPFLQLKSYTENGLKYLNKILTDGSYTTFSPFRLLDLVDQFVPAFIGMTCRFTLGSKKVTPVSRPAYLPPSLVYKLGLCNITSFTAWSQKLPVGLNSIGSNFLSEMLKCFADESYEGLKNWFLSNKFNSSQGTLIMTRIFKSILAFYINRPADRQLIDKKLFDNQFLLVMNKWQIKVFLYLSIVCRVYFSAETPRAWSC
jgi:hypothetical protein